MESSDGKIYSSSFPHSSSTSKQRNYDVFLSYKPKDTLKNFTGHLFTALDRADISTFRPYHNSLLMGDDVRLESFKAIQESRVSIIVFSKNYVSSSSCRDELVRILECEKTHRRLIIPVFYEVNPIDLLKQVQSFGIVFEAANLSEWDMRVIAGGHEAKFIQKIVGHVLDKVRRIKLHVAKHPVGLDSRVEYLNSILKIGPGDVRMVGVYGMGGIGKTTITKSFFNVAFHLFEGSCFLANIREEAKSSNGIARLQGQLLFGIRILKDKCLLRIYENQTVGMHDLLRDMGRHIVRSTLPGKHSRLWLHKDVCQILTNLKILNLSKSKLLRASPDFSGTPNLEELYLKNCKNMSSVHPSIGCLRRLTELSMGSCSNLQSLPNSICNATSLESLNLYDYSNLHQLPEDLGSLRCLKVLHVDKTAIKKLPDSIGLLANLIELNLNLCLKLSALPNNICNLRSLEVLIVNRCPKLEELPADLGNMECLRELDVAGTAIKCLPDSIRHLKNLTELYLSDNCRSLVSKSHFHFMSFDFLASPTCLNATSFLPSAVSCLHSLSELNLSSCSLSDGDIPDDLTGLSSLHTLDIRYNMFCVLPSSLGQLTTLEELYLCSCWKLKTVMEFPPNLHRLTSRDCRSLENIPHLSNMKFLRHLNLECCCKLVEILGLEKLNCLQEIYLEGCYCLSTSFENSLFQGYSGRFLTCSLYLSRRAIPHWFHHQRLGSSISFVVENDYVELALWVDYVQEAKDMGLDNIGVVMHNKTNGIKWSNNGYTFNSIAPGAKTWVNFGSQIYPLKTGDQIEVSFEAHGDLKVDKCGIHLAYNLIR
ncbi:hypothetical protein L1987_62164 [Smallanthus sonchifolius]|uniref:Uncharacterized protein n=1 Tax=Smallanthus sonchifolius TaxID=185202 RepID=A0ACB9C9M0_9ASTR|nr:hypothetical protein L1987_62164 [Smallanthus sonchifolius]